MQISVVLCVETKTLRSCIGSSLVETGCHRREAISLATLTCGLRAKLAPR
jgi:hypothetical protein